MNSHRSKCDDRQVYRLPASENPPGIRSSLPPGLGAISALADVAVGLLADLAPLDWDVCFSSRFDLRI
jgi:hypothetical protein